MKKLLVVIGFMFGILIFSNYDLKAQAVSTVHDPSNLQQNIQNGTLLASLGASMDVIKETEKKLDKIRKAVDWIETMASVQEFIRLVESMTCMIKDLQVNIDISKQLGIINNYNSCLFNFNYKINAVNLRAGVDFLNLLLKKGMSMERGERMQALKMAMEKFVNSQKGLHKLNQDLKVLITRNEYNMRQEDKVDKFFNYAISRRR